MVRLNAFESTVRMTFRGYVTQSEEWTRMNRIADLRREEERNESKKLQAAAEREAAAEMKAARKAAKEKALAESADAKVSNPVTYPIAHLPPSKMDEKTRDTIVRYITKKLNEEEKKKASLEETLTRLENDIRPLDTDTTEEDIHVWIDPHENKIREYREALNPIKKKVELLSQTVRWYTEGEEGHEPDWRLSIQMNEQTVVDKKDLKRLLEKLKLDWLHSLFRYLPGVAWLIYTRKRDDISRRDLGIIVDDMARDAQDAYQKRLLTKLREWVVGGFKDTTFGRHDDGTWVLSLSEEHCKKIDAKIEYHKSTVRKKRWKVL